MKILGALSLFLILCVEGVVLGKGAGENVGVVDFRDYERKTEGACQNVLSVAPGTEPVYFLPSEAGCLWGSRMRDGKSGVMLNLSMIDGALETTWETKDIAISFAAPDLDITRTKDAGFIIAGWSYASVSERKNFANPVTWIFKTDKKGNRMWEKTFYRAPTFQFSDSQEVRVAQTSDDGFVAAWSVIPDSDEFMMNQTMHVYIAKTDSFGNMIWEADYRADGYNEPYGIRELPGGSFQLVIVAYREAFGNQLIVLDYSHQGKLLEKKQVSDASLGTLNNILPTGDGGFIVGSDLPGEGAGECSGVLLIKLDREMKTEWMKNYMGAGCEHLRALNVTPDGGYIAAVSSGSDGRAGRKIWLLKISSGGNLEWSESMGGKDISSPAAVYEMPDGGYTMLGTVIECDWGKSARDLQQGGCKYRISYTRIDKKGKCEFEMKSSGEN